MIELQEPDNSLVVLNTGCEYPPSSCYSDSHRADNPIWLISDEHLWWKEMAITGLLSNKERSTLLKTGRYHQVCCLQLR